MKTETQSIEVQKYLYLKKASGIKQQTIEEYRNILQSFYEWRKGKDSALGTDEYVEYINHLVSIGRKATTIRLHSIVLKGYFQHIGFNTSKLKLYKATPPPVRTVRKEDVDKMIAGIEGDTEIAWRNRSIVLLLSTSGIRAHELCALNRDDITIKQERGVKQVEIQIKNGKGGKARVARATTQTKDTIDIYLATRTDDNKALFLSNRGGGKSKGGIRLDRHGLVYTVKQIAENVGLEDVSTHTLRHYCITELLRRGISTSMVQKLVGHSDLNTTSRYTHFVDRDEWDAYSGAME